MTLAVKLPVLLVLLAPSVLATVVTVTLSGVTSGGDFVVTQNSYSGPFAGLPADYNTTGATTTTFASGTPWTAQFTYDTAQMPAPIQSNITTLNGADPITTHIQDSTTAPWTSATLNIGGFTFTTAAGPLDTAPAATPPNQTLTVNAPLSFGNRFAYGDTIFASQGLLGTSTVQNSYLYQDSTVGPGTPSSQNFGHFGSFTFFLYQSNTQGPLFAGPGIPTSFNFKDADLSNGIPDLGVGYVSFSTFQDLIATVNGALLLDSSFAFLTTTTGTLAVESAVTSDITISGVPEPSTLALAAAGIALGVLRKSLRRS